MKYPWIDKIGEIGKKRSLFKFGGYALLVVVLVILVTFIGSRSSGLSNRGGYSLTVAPNVVNPSLSGAPKLRSVSNQSAVLPPSANPAPSSNTDTSGTASGGKSTNSSTTGQNAQSSDIGPQYLAKTLKVDLNVKDTRKVADDLLRWITTTDPRATSTGTDYEQTGDNLYNVSLTFSVQATRYPQIYRYLRDYTTQNGGHLVTFTESIQDVTGTYVDTQSRLQNLRAEQGRLQDLLSHAQALSDILSIDQQLTDVEGQIESDEAQFKSLTSQVTFYTVSVSLEPIETAAPPPPSNTGWSVGQIFHDAFGASLAFGQGVLALLVWLLAFGLYIVPLAIVIWLGRSWYTRIRRAPLPKVATETSSPVNEGTTEDPVPVAEGVTEHPVPVNG